MEIYKAWLHERQKLLDEVNNHSKIEKYLLTRFKKNIFNNDSYFKLDDFMFDKSLKFFQGFIFIGPRNIGKTTAIKMYCEDEVKKGKSFIWMRITKDDAEMFGASEVSKWFEKNGWFYHRASGQVYVPKNKERANRLDNIDYVVGYIIGLSTVKKGIDYDDVSVICFDEFMDGKNNIPNKVDKIVQFITTVERHKKNKDFRLLFAANYMSQDEPILRLLGVSGIKKSKQPLVKFNWITKTLVINLPKDAYMPFKVENRLGYRYSIAAGLRTFKAEYGSTFENRFKTNICDVEKLMRKEGWFYLWFGDIKLLFGKSYKKSKQNLDRYFVVDYEMMPQQKVKEYVLFERDKFLHINAQMLSNTTFVKLKKLWLNEKLFAGGILEAEIMLDIFTTKTFGVEQHNWKVVEIK